MARIGISSVEHRRGDIGYTIRQEWWGHGLATEAVGCLVKFGFGPLRLHRIEATHHPDNPASGRVLIHAGFQREGVVRHHMYVQGAWRDSVLYGLLEGDR
jgi:RimJ/RimL family protein N-acetyltransferase